jgi:hypothetical protein
LEDSGFVSRDKRIISGKVKSQTPFSDSFNWREFSFTVSPKTKREAVAFSDGLRLAIEIIGEISFPEFLDDAMKEYGLTLNVSKIVRERLRSDNEFEKRLEKQPEEIKERRRKFKEEMRQHFPLPNEILRKVRKPKVSKNEILRLRRVIKEHVGLPYVEEIAKKVNLTSSELVSLVREANRQKMKIDIGTSEGKEILIVN